MESCSLPAALIATPSPLIALIGLDSVDRHSHLWRAFSAPSIVTGHSGTASGPQQDRVPLRWLLLNDVSSLPQPKPKRSSYEWFIPKGILKTNWLNKHLNVLPAVAVIFMELDWNDQDWTEKKSECASRVQSVRAVLHGRATKLAVVLIQHESNPAEFASGGVGVSDGASSTEKAAELCSACELSPRSLFVLPVIGKDGIPISDGATLAGYVARLENAFYELAQNYYHQEIRNVKSHRDFLNKTTHLYLFVRHQFKSGFLNELKRDPHAAYKHYQQAYNLLMEVRATDTNIMEVKTVAGYINYKICRLAFQLNLPRDAIAQYRRHMDIFKHKIGSEGLAFEHSGWQSEQSRTFAEIFSDAIRHGLPAIQTQHPGLYYQQAATYAIIRRKCAEELCSDVQAYPDPDPLANEDKLDFYGQRPWRPGKVSIEPPEMELERAAIRALLFRERTLRPTHSELIVALLGKAIEQYRSFRWPRAQSHLSVQMAEELMAGQKYRQALDLLRPIVGQYRRQGWSVLLNAGLSLGLKCAFLTASVEDYITFGLELAKKIDKRSMAKEECDEKHRIMSNISKIFQNNGQIPSAEPGLTSKAERGAVGEAAQLWSQLLSSKVSKPIEVQMDFDISRNSALTVFPVFEASKLKADEKTSLTCYVKNDIPASDNPELALPLKSLLVCIVQNPDRKIGQPGPTREHVYLEEKTPESSKETTTELLPGKTKSYQFKFFPDGRDVGKRVVVEKAIVSLGRPDSNISLDLHMTLHDPSVCDVEEELETEFFFRKGPKFLSYDVTDGMAELDISGSGHTFSKVEIEPRNPKLNMELQYKGPILVNEWFVVTVQLTNAENLPIRDVIVTSSLTEASDPIISDTTRLVLDFKMPEPVTPMTPTTDNVADKFSFASPPAVQKVSEMSINEKLSIKFFLRASTTAQRSVCFETDYSIQDPENPEKHFRCFLSETIHLETVEPFIVGSELLSTPRQLSLESAYTDEQFLILPELKSLSSHTIKIVDTSLEVRFPVQKLSPVPSQLAGCCMERDSVGNECYPLLVQKKDLIKDQSSHALEEQDVTVGRYVVKWIREEYDGIAEFDSDFVSVSTYELSSVRVRSSTIFASSHIAAPFATVRTPLQVTYIFVNRSERVQEFVLAMEPSEAFMLSGNKQLHFKLLPFGGKAELNYILYPLLAGEAVPLPRPRLTSVRLSTHPQDDDVSETLERLLLTHITVLPRKRDKDSSDVSLPSKLILATSKKGDYFQLEKPIFLENNPFVQTAKIRSS